MNTIINLTQHNPTRDQKSLINTTEEIKVLLTFERMPTSSELGERAESLATIAWNIYLSKVSDVLGGAWNDGCGNAGNPNYTKLWVAEMLTQDVLIGGLPSLMHPLEDALIRKGLRPVYAFSKRISTDLGEGKKEVKFVHEGYYHPS